MMNSLNVEIEGEHNKALLIQFVRNLKFVKNAYFKDEELIELSNEEKIAIDEAIDELDAGKGISNDEVIRRRKEKYPNLF